MENILCVFKTQYWFLFLQTCRAMMANLTDREMAPDRLTETERKMERNQMRNVPFKMLVLQNNIL